MTLLVHVYAIFVTAAPIIDGDIENSAWNNGSVVWRKMFTNATASGNDITAATLWVIPDFAADRFFFALRAEDARLAADSPVGVRLYVEGFGAAEFSLAAPVDYDVESLHVHAALAVRPYFGDGTFEAEAAVSLKRTVPRTLSIVLQILDAAGEPSRPYTFQLINERYTDPASAPPPILTPTTPTTKAQPATTTRPITTRPVTSDPPIVVTPPPWFVDYTTPPIVTSDQHIAVTKVDTMSLPNPSTIVTEGGAANGVAAPENPPKPSPPAVAAPQDTPALDVQTPELPIPANADASEIFAADPVASPAEVDASRPAKALRTLAMLAAFLLLCAAAVVG
ncbi:MAG: hypothetical protein LBN05_02435, partial [Oscillospiraceae bacterium]|nr:hypothetical protein [Oscillospiraceae bacterium]